MAKSLITNFPPIWRRKHKPVPEPVDPEINMGDFNAVITDLTNGHILVLRVKERGDLQGVYFRLGDENS